VPHTEPTVVASAEQPQVKFSTPLGMPVMRLWWIDHGIYREITQAELDRTTIWSGGRTSKGKPDFRLNGKMYVFDKHPEGYHQCQST
jgi:hypothetical protein